MDYQDLSNLVALFGSAALMTYGFITDFFLAVPGVILFTALMSYFFQRRMHQDTRKYEKRKLAVTEVLGPIHGELLQIMNSFEADQKNYFLNAPNTLSMGDEWQKIRNGYKFYLIPKELSGQLEKFFTELDELRPGYVSTRITNLAAKVCDSLLGGFKLSNSPNFTVKVEDGGVSQTWFWGLVFWKVEPTTQKPGRL